MNKLRILTWKYFFKQKWKEIKEALMIILPISLIIGGVCITFYEYKISLIIGIIILSFWILIGILKLIKHIFKWIKSNWVMAKEKAEQELNPIEEIDLGE